MVRKTVKDEAIITLIKKFPKMLEERGHKFVRYADDCNIYVKSSRAAGRVMESCTKFLEWKLKLKVNRKPNEAEGFGVQPV
ncbi:MAG: hypothetical protein LBD79_07545 [Treponema sp.]|jgi:retron-type reverse transcriptase|nr:hypothetical protein [Treponema sp.]